MRSVNSDDILDGKIYVSTFQRWQARNKEGTKNKDNQITNNKTTQVTIKGNKIMLLYFRQDCIIFLFILRFSFIRPIEWIKECKHNVHWNSLYALDINSSLLAPLVPIQCSVYESVYESVHESLLGQYGILDPPAVGISTGLRYDSTTLNPSWLCACLLCK